MRFVIIGLLLDGPLSGYAVQQRFAQVVSLVYSASLGSIQRALQALVDDGLAIVEADPSSARGRRLHRLTASARPLWEQWMLAPVDGGQLEREMLARVFFLDRLGRADARLTALRGLRHRAEHELAALRALEARVAAPDGFTSQLATLDYGLRSTALAIDWLRELEVTELGRNDAQPAELDRNAHEADAQGRAR